MKCEKNEYQLFGKGKNGQRRRDEGTKREREGEYREMDALERTGPPERKGASRRRGGSKR